MVEAIQQGLVNFSGEQTVYLNGAWSPIEQAKISVLDRGFIFGDGIYEVVPVYAGQPFRWPQHLTRLKRSLAKLRIDNPHTDAQWTELARALVARHAWKDQFVYMQVTRGVAKRDHAFPKDVQPTVFAMASQLVPVAQSVREQGISLISLPDERWLHCDVKSTSLLGNVLARQAAADANALECVMFRDGYLTEGSSSNVWVVRGGKLLGVPRDNLILEGIRVGLMNELCEAAGVSLEIRRITREEVQDADEIMISSATKEVLAASRLDGRPIGKKLGKNLGEDPSKASDRGLDVAKPGPIYQKLYQAYQAAKSRSQGW